MTPVTVRLLKDIGLLTVTSMDEQPRVDTYHGAMLLVTCLQGPKARR